MSSSVIFASTAQGGTVNEEEKMQAQLIRQSLKAARSYEFGNASRLLAEAEAIKPLSDRQLTSFERKLPSDYDEKYFQYHREK